jgi:hypothetical protein
MLGDGSERVKGKSGCKQEEGDEGQVDEWNYFFCLVARGGCCSLVIRLKAGLR